VLSEITLEKNVDRIVDLGKGEYLATSYHLKDGVKSGDLNILTI
jgi:hypothetical protein